MVHNGIEYGDMQLICEAYHLMKDVLAMEHDEMSKVSQRRSWERSKEGLVRSKNDSVRGRPF